MQVTTDMSAGMSMYAGKGIYEWGCTGMSLHALIEHDVQV